MASWPNGSTTILRDVQANQTVQVSQSEAQPKTPPKEEKTLFRQLPPEEMGITAVHRENPYNDFEKEILLPYKQSTSGPALTQGDVDGDGIIEKPRPDVGRSLKTGVCLRVTG